MNKCLFSFCLMLSIAFQTSGQRFVTEVFPGYTKTSNVVYANNFSVLTGTPTAVDLAMDVYEPSGATDTMSHRPLVILLHEGANLPILINQEPIGSRDDSANVEMCKQFARRGYVVANIEYRLGWNPAGSNVDIRRGTLIVGTYRGIQDVKACVRYFHKDEATTNQFKIDSNRVIIGGGGSGGTIAINYICLHTPAQISLPKYISSVTDATYGFVAGQPYINMSAIGDYSGYGGIPTLNNPNNSVGYGDNVQFAFTMGSVLGDSSWMTAGNAPIVAFHEIGNPTTPYGNGIVYVPTVPPQAVVDVSGSSIYVARADQVGNNDCFNNARFKNLYASDPYTIAANNFNGGNEGLYPFATNPAAQYGPWDWFDSTAIVNLALSYGMTVGQGDTIYWGGLITNPDMSKAKALKYIDTIMGYLNPRMAYCLGLIPGLNVNQIAKNNQVEIFPNPVTDILTVKTNVWDDLIGKVELFDMTGRLVMRIDNINKTEMTFGKGDISPGVYFIAVYTTAEKIVKKLVVE